MFFTLKNTATGSLFLTALRGRVSDEGNRATIPIRGAELIKFIQRTVFEKKIMYDLLVDILLANDESDIIEVLEEKKFDIPKDWKPQCSSTHIHIQDTTLHEATKVSESLADYNINGGGSIDDEQKMSTNTDAHTLARLYLTNNGYMLVPTDHEAAPGIIKAYKGEEKKAFIVLSAKAGTLYLGQNNWLRLGWDNVELLVLTGDNSSDFVHFRSQKELLEKKDNDYTIMVKKNTRNPEVLTALTEVLKEEEDFARFYFKVKQNSTIFESIKGFDQQSPEENAVINEQELLSWL